eukprot:1156373-Pelagomonas_calceolata.AAC.3
MYLGADSFLYGKRSGVTERIASRLTQEKLGLSLAGLYTPAPITCFPMFELDTAPGVVGEQDFFADPGGGSSILEGCRGYRSQCTTEMEWHDKKPATLDDEALWIAPKILLAVKRLD